MKVAVMQPYFFPYVGYFQLISACDVFVILDDVNYKKQGWINRNRILLGNKPKLITLAVESASQNKLINQLYVSSNKTKLLSTIYHCYSKAPFFKSTFPLIEDIFSCNQKNLVDFLSYSLIKVSEYFEIERKWYWSSKLDTAPKNSGQSRIIHLCRKLSAEHYINLPGGRELYEHKTFSDSGVKLSFINSFQRSYEQFDNNFVDNLSIIDLMMFNSRKECADIIRGFNLTN
jgi:hypothetical protein